MAEHARRRQQDNSFRRHGVPPIFRTFSGCAQCRFRTTLWKPPFGNGLVMDVTAVCVLDRIIDDTGCDRVEVHVRDGLPELIGRVDDPRSVSALPEPSEEAPTAVETSGVSGLKAQHRTPERVNTGRDHQMTVVADQARHGITAMHGRDSQSPPEHRRLQK